PGEALRTRDGSAVVESVRAEPGAHRVYNIEVESTHSYLVGELGLLSHNDNPCAADGPPNEAALRAAQDIVDKGGRVGGEGALWLPSPDLPLATARLSLPPLPGFTDVVVDADLHTFRAIDGSYLSTRQVADLIRQQVPAGQPIRIRLASGPVAAGFPRI